MSNNTATATTTVAAAPRSWKEFGKVCVAYFCDILTYPTRKTESLIRSAKKWVIETYTKFIAEKVRAFVAKAYYRTKMTVYGLAGTAAICAALTCGLVYGGVLSSEDVKEAVIEVTPRSWMQAAYDIGVVAPYQASANADGYVRKSVGL